MKPLEALLPTYLPTYPELFLNELLEARGHGRGGVRQVAQRTDTLLSNTGDRGVNIRYHNVYTCTVIIHEPLLFLYVCTKIVMITRGIGK